MTSEDLESLPDWPHSSDCQNESGTQHVKRDSSDHNAKLNVYPDFLWISPCTGCLIESLKSDIHRKFPRSGRWRLEESSLDLLLLRGEDPPDEVEELLCVLRSNSKDSKVECIFPEETSLWAANENQGSGREEANSEAESHMDSSLDMERTCGTKVDITDSGDPASVEDSLETVFDCYGCNDFGHTISIMAGPRQIHGEFQGRDG